MMVLGVDVLCYAVLYYAHLSSPLWSSATPEEMQSRDVEVVCPGIDVLVRRT